MEILFLRVEADERIRQSFCAASLKENDTQKCFEQWKKRLHKYVDSIGVIF